MLRASLTADTFLALLPLPTAQKHMPSEPHRTHPHPHKITQGVREVEAAPGAHTEVTVPS